MAAAAAATSCHLLLIRRSQPPSPPSSSSSLISFLKPLFVPSSNALSISLQKPYLHPPLGKTLFPSLFTASSSRAFPRSPPLLPAAVGGSAQKYTEDAVQEEEAEEYDEKTDVSDDEPETEGGEGGDLKVTQAADSSSSPLERKREERLKLEVPSLTVKERKELASYAHSLGKKLKTQLVGKSGVTPNLATSFSDTLEANELLKIKIHRSCPGELEDVVKQLEEATSSVMVGQIGRTLIIYRPSLSKLKAEEKKKQVRKLFLEKQQRRRLKLSKEQVPNSSRRGSSWKAKLQSKEQVPNSSQWGSSWKERARDRSS